MPLYEYVCRQCSTHFEALMPASRRDAGETHCPQCGADRVARRISLVADPVVKGASGGASEPWSCGASQCCGGGCAQDE